MPFGSSFQSRGNPGSRWGRSSSVAATDDQDDLDSFNKRIENAKLRIEDSGNTAQDADQRNWFEKLTNLPKNQNAFFDVLDLLGRPLQAIEGAVVGAQRGDDNVAKDAFHGFSGQEHFSGQQIAQGLGVNNKWAKGALGFGIDVLADPLTYIPGGALLKGAKTAIKPVSALAKGGYELAEKIPAFGRLSEQYFRPGVNAVKEGLGQAFIPNYGLNRTLEGGTDEALVNAARENENTRRYLQNKSVHDVVHAAREAGGVKTGTDVGRIMEAPLKQFEDVPGYEFPGGDFTPNRSDVLDQLGQQKGTLRTAGADLKMQAKGFKKAELELAGGLNQTNQKIRSIYERVARTAGSEIERNHARQVIDATKQIDRVDGKLADLDKGHEALLRRYKKDYRDNHAAQFDLFRKVKEFAPQGIRLPDHDISALPAKLRGIVRDKGKGIDELADELGYVDSETLLKDLDHLARQPRKLDGATLSGMAAQRAERDGSLADLEQQRAALQETRDTLQQSLQDLAGRDVASDAENGIISAVASHPEYQRLTDQRRTLEDQLAGLRTDRDATLTTGRKGVQGLQDTIDQLRGAADNTVVHSQPVVRPERELSEDAAIQDAARRLTESNQNIRDYARESGIEIPELEGYMKHVLSQAERDLRSRGSGKALSVDQGRFGSANPSKKVLAGRELTGSVEDVNERIGREFFEPNAFFATAHGQQQLINYIQAVKLRKEVLDDPNFARLIKKGEKVTPGKNEAVIDVNNYKFLRDSATTPGTLGDELGQQATEEIGGQYLVTKGAKALLDRYAKLTSDEGTKAFLKAYDGITNGWKKLALMSPNYAIRNFIGGISQNFLGGITNPANLTKYTLDAAKELSRKGGSELLDEFKRQGLAGGETANTFLRSSNPEKALNKEIEAESRSRTARTLRNPIRVTAEAGDDVNRLALYKWARDKGMTPEQAAAKVRQVHFDYQDLTPVERNVFARVIPFYRWMRKNTPFQINNFVQNPARYAALNKIRTNAQEAQGLTEENVPDYMKESYTLPITGNGKGKGLMLGLSLPIGDLSKLSDPLGTITDSFAEPITLPIELATNRDFFRNRDISQYAGDTTDYGVGSGQLQLNPKLAYAIEALGGQPARLASMLTKQSDVQDQEAKILQPSLGIALPLKEYNAQQFQTAKARQELQQLLDYIQYLKDNGVEVRDTNQIR